MEKESTKIDKLLQELISSISCKKISDVMKSYSELKNLEYSLKLNEIKNLENDKYGNLDGRKCIKASKVELNNVVNREKFNLNIEKIKSKISKSENNNDHQAMNEFNLISDDEQQEKEEKTKIILNEDNIKYNENLSLNLISNIFSEEQKNNEILRANLINSENRDNFLENSIGSFYAKKEEFRNSFHLRNVNKLHIYENELLAITSNLIESEQKKEGVNRFELENEAVKSKCGENKETCENKIKESKILEKNIEKLEIIEKNFEKNINPNIELDISRKNNENDFVTSFSNRNDEIIINNNIQIIDSSPTIYINPERNLLDGNIQLDLDLFKPNMSYKRMNEF